MSIVHFGRKSRPSALALKERLTEAGYNGVDINYGLGIESDALNRPEAIENASNKREALIIMRNNDIPIPSLASFEDDEFANIRDMQYPVVGRPDKHSKGRHFYLCNNYEDVQRALSKRVPATHFLQYISGAREFRVHIMKDGRDGMDDKYRSIKVSEKMPLEIDAERQTGIADYVNVTFARNHDNGTVFHYTEITDQDRKKLRKAARGAVKALGLDFGAVDILLKDGQVYVLEVNTAPRLTDETSDTLDKYVECFKRYWDA